MSEFQSLNLLETCFRYDNDSPISSLGFTLLNVISRLVPLLKHEMITIPEHLFTAQVYIYVGRSYCSPSYMSFAVYCHVHYGLGVRVMVFNATFNNI